MKINSIKTFGMRIGTAKYNHTYKAQNKKEIEFKSNFKDLGITVSSDGSYKEHITIIRKKAYRKCGCILRTFHNRSTQFLARIFKILMLPYFDSGSQLWLPN